MYHIREALYCSHGPGVRRPCLENKGLSSVSSLTSPPLRPRLRSSLVATDAPTGTSRAVVLITSPASRPLQLGPLPPPHLLSGCQPRARVPIPILRIRPHPDSYSEYN